MPSGDYYRRDYVVAYRVSRLLLCIVLMTQHTTISLYDVTETFTKDDHLTTVRFIHNEAA